MVFTTIQLTPLKECAAATSIDKVSAVKSKPDAHHRLHGCREPSIKNGRKKKSRTIPSLDGFFFSFFSWAFSFCGRLAYFATEPFSEKTLPIEKGTQRSFNRSRH